MTWFAEIRGIATHVAIDGPPGAPAILLLHSLGTNLHVWDAQAEALARGLRVVRFDLRGHGLSESGGAAVTVEDFADDALAVLDACGVATPPVAGAPIGGLISQAAPPPAPARW